MVADGDSQKWGSNQQLSARVSLLDTAEIPSNTTRTIKSFRKNTFHPNTILPRSAS
jgi:hypothetical protein